MTWPSGYALFSQHPRRRRRWDLQLGPDPVHLRGDPEFAVPDAALCPAHRHLIFCLAEVEKVPQWSTIGERSEEIVLAVLALLRRMCE